MGYTQLRAAPAGLSLGGYNRGDSTWEGVSCLASLLLHPGVPWQGLLCPLPAWPPMMCW